jgi:DNA-binding response OmpR family regulator
MRFLRDFRSRGCVAPVLITTARSELRHRLLALREGADDYLVKPFSLEELVARLQALMRRPRSLLGRHLVAGNLAFDPETHQIRIGGTFAPLRLKEAFVLELLLRYKGTVVPRSYIEAQLFGLDGSQDANVIDVYMHRIRKRLADGGATVTVHTVRGIGFLLTEDR